MGLLKKITKPISKFLDKVVPNEIKPALPFLSAAMPFMMGPAGIGASPSFWNTMMGRAIMMGGANLGSQLSQEGSEGDFNPMSLAMASGIGALSAPGNPGTAIGSPQMGSVGYQPSAAEFLKTKAGGMDPGWIKGGTEMLGKGADFIRASQGTLTDPGFNMATLKAASVPVAQGMGDLAFADAQRALRDFENQPDESGMGINDDGRRRAIRAAMEAAGHIEDDILDAIASLGLKGGGIVGLKHGGRIGLYQGGGPHGGSSQGNTGGTKGGNKGGWSPSVGRSKKGYLSGHPGGGTTTGGTTKTNLRNVPIRKPKKSVWENLQTHFTNNQKLADAVKKGLISTEDYNVLGGIDVNKTLGLGPVTTGITSTAYNAVQSLLGNQPVSDIAGDVSRNIYGSTLGDDTTYGRQYNEIINSGVKDGGRIGLFQGGGEFEAPDFMNMSEVVENVNGDIVEEENITEANASNRIKQLYEQIEAGVNVDESKTELFQRFKINLFNTGGRVNKNTGGMMSVLPKGREMDYRGGGVIPMGSKERADDVPARLSKNEFVMTADAVKAAGGGSVNKGAKRMYNLMHKLEARV